MHVDYEIQSHWSIDFPDGTYCGLPRLLITLSFQLSGVLSPATAYKYFSTRSAAIS